MKLKTEAIEATVPVMANRAPWNEIVLQGKRRVKTLSFNWKHRGPILLYTSLSRENDNGRDNYELGGVECPQGAIVGIATVVDVMPTKDLPTIFFDEDPNLYASTGQSHVVILTEPKRFKRPIPFKPPKGAMRIFRAPATLLRRVTI